MEDPWKTLALSGLPDGAPRPRPMSVDLAAVREALSSLEVDALTEVQQVVLVAWLEAFRHHWPDRFARDLGDYEELRIALHRRPLDQNRYLKLRRIAVENLAAAL